MLDDLERLSEENERFLEDCLLAGRAPEDVINKALDMLRAAEGPVEIPPERREWLRREIQKGIESAERGELYELGIDEFLARMHAKYLGRKKGA